MRALRESNRRLLDLNGLDALIGELEHRGYEVSGPQVRDGVIAHDRLTSVDALPVGWTDEQEGGHYRLVPRADQARFGYAVGPQSWKELLHPPRVKVWTIARRRPGQDPLADRVDGGLDISMDEPKAPRRALIGVRPCELAAIAKQDRVLLEGPHPDPHYGANRVDVVIVAMACGDPAATCFCASMGTGPAVGAGADLAVTELVDDGPEASPNYVVEARTELGADLLAAVAGSAPSDDDLDAAAGVVERAEAAMGRHLDTDGITERIYASLDSPRWDALADRCLSCANCTLACPTCFCTDLEDVTDLAGDHTDRWRVWDSCFSLDFSHLGPGPVRASTGSRYRQWLVHKLASWHDQYGESGCVGCGRCITWCPVGIDLTAEVAAIDEEPSA